MHISTKGRYGLRVMLDLALHCNGGPTALKDIAARQELSKKYLWQVVRPLAAAGLLTAVRGARGGYRLARPASAITFQDIFFALEGPCELAPCLDTPRSCRRHNGCPTRAVWQNLQDVIVVHLRSQTLQTLAEKYDTQRAGCSYEI